MSVFACGLAARAIAGGAGAELQAATSDEHVHPVPDRRLNASGIALRDMIGGELKPGYEGLSDTRAAEACQMCEAARPEGHRGEHWICLEGSCNGGVGWCWCSQDEVGRSRKVCPGHMQECLPDELPPVAKLV